MTETTNSFFDSNKLYLKSVQHEAVLRAGARANRDDEDPLYDDELRQAFPSPVTGA